ncbi:MAG TPA: NUDIX domain-containing protein [Spirochaetia bacterium]|nr:NUDIX domain-containing protein [Spirochaetia bacterium]
MTTKRDFTATTLVVHRNRVLLHRHRKLGLVLPLGGHIESGELPDEAAIREVREESGLDVELILPEPVWPLADVRQLARPIAVLLEDIEPGHQHVDLIYAATLKRPESESGHPAGSGTEELMWLSSADIDLVSMPENVRVLSHYALRLVESSAAEPTDGVRNDLLPRPDRPALA